VGDPVTYRGAHKIEFSLQLDVLSLLLVTPDLQLFAEPMAGLGAEQWIRRIVVNNRAGKTIMDVSIRPDIVLFSRALALPGAFETLDVILPAYSTRPLAIRPPDGWFAFHHETNVTIGFHHLAVRRHSPVREMVVIRAGDTCFMVDSSSAVEFYGASPWSSTFAHLDVHLWQLPDKQILGGILAELWGLAPMTEAVRERTKDPGL